MAELLVLRLLSVAVVQDSGEVCEDLQFGEIWDWRGCLLKGAVFTGNLLCSERTPLCHCVRGHKMLTGDNADSVTSGAHCQHHSRLPEAWNSMGKWKRNRKKGILNKIW